ncbi:hypothetical protein MPSEU_000142600 [Mayamaea pseudoterrestris]|nr:hypothetical protein MPSEU_000142600 [Mayamaea pseudoterrestris]
MAYPENTAVPGIVTSCQGPAPCQYLLLKLQRPSLQVPWGLTLSMFDGSVVLLGNVNQLALSRLMLESHEKRCHYSPCIFWNRASHVDVSTWTRFLSLQQQLQGLSAYATSVNRSAFGDNARLLHETLLPGDCIIAVNGFRVVEIARSLKELTDYLRLQTSLSLLVYRNPCATSAAKAVNGMTATPINVSQAAYQAIRKVYPLLAAAKRPVVVTPPRGQPGTSRPFKLPPFHQVQYLNQPSAPRQLYVTSPAPPICYRNPLFTDSVTGKNLPYEDNWEIDNFVQEDGMQEHLFLKPIDNYAAWLEKRKRTWRKRYRVYALDDEPQHDREIVERLATNVPIDFWTRQGYSSLQEWMAVSTRKWKQSYSWNQRKRRKLEHDCEQIVSLDNGNFVEWLSIRKHQWLILRRVRYRQRLEEQHVEMMHTPEVDLAGMSSNHDIVLVDALLEEQEKKQRALKSRDPLDLLFFLDGKNGVPDDVVAHSIRYLEPMERRNLLAISRKTNHALCAREDVWRQLCESHWKIPRRPRKPWHEIYFTTLRRETEGSRIKIDALLANASAILLKADHVQAIEKLVKEVEKDKTLDFVNYSSGVVCERNSLLNLAVIHRRHKTVKWLCERKGADIETSDRGQFTPLMNAAWGGDRYLVRYFMHRGADRFKIGRCHYTKPLAAPDFKGFDAAGWAEQRGHPEIAKLIRMGL